MKCNIGRKNRSSRLIGGLIILIFALYLYNLNQVLSAIGAFIGIIMVLEAASGYCIIHGLRRTKDMR